MSSLDLFPSTSEDPRSISEMATRIRLLLEKSAGRAYAQRGPLEWVRMYLCQEAVEHVLEGVLGVLRSMDHIEEAAKFIEIPTEELCPYWERQLLAHANVSARAAPDVVELQFETIRDVAGAVQAMSSQRTRAVNLLANGPPAGLRAFPELSTVEKSKTLAIPFAGDRPDGLRASRDDYLKYTQHVSSCRRVSGARATSCTAPDTIHPELYI